jgi:hypothetical protein
MIIILPALLDREVNTEGEMSTEEGEIARSCLLQWSGFNKSCGRLETQRYDELSFTLLIKQ